MGLIPMREQALLEPSSRGFPGAQRARTRVLGRGCKYRNSQAFQSASCSLSRPASHRASLPASREGAREPARHGGAQGQRRRHLPFLQMGQHWSGSYTGSTHSVCGHADTAHSTSPLASQRHRSHGDTCNTGHGQGQCLHPRLKPHTLPQPVRTGTQVGEAPLGVSTPTRPDKDPRLLSPSQLHTGEPLYFY